MLCSRVKWNVLSAAIFSPEWASMSFTSGSGVGVGSTSGSEEHAVSSASRKATTSGPIPLRCTGNRGCAGARTWACAIFVPGRGPPYRNRLRLRIPVPVGGENRVIGQVGHLPPTDESRDQTPGNEAERDRASYPDRKALDDLPAGESSLGLALLAHVCNALHWCGVSRLIIAQAGVRNKRSGASCSGVGELLKDLAPGVRIAAAHSLPVDDNAVAVYRHLG